MYSCFFTENITLFTFKVSTSLPLSTQFDEKTKVFQEVAISYEFVWFDLCENIRFLEKSKKVHP